VYKLCRELPHQVENPHASRHDPAEAYSLSRTSLYFLSEDLYVLFYGKSINKSLPHILFGMRSIGYFLEEVVEQQLSLFTEDLISLHFHFLNYYVYKL
jgi:hypothetical protein